MGSSTVLSNSQCTITLAQSYPSNSGNDLYLNLFVTFNSQWTGQKNVYEIVWDRTQQNTGWVQVGTWTVGTSGGGGSWYSTGGTWTHRKAITIDHTKASGSTALSNFPVLVSLASDANLAAGAQASGNDILFTASDGVTKLNHQIEQYTPGSGQLVAWVQVPTLSNTADTVVYMYYGNASASNQQNAAGVWDSNYKGVWHLNNGSALSLNDSTANGNNGTNHGATAGATAQIGSVSAALNGSGYITGSGLSSLANSAYTVSYWLYVDTTANQGYQAAFGAGSVYGVTDGNIFAGISDYSVTTKLSQWTEEAYCNYGSSIYHRWTHFTFTLDSSKHFAIYLNGQLGTYSGCSGTLTGLYQGNGDWAIGTLPSQIYYFVYGNLQEVRASNTNRSAGWIATEYTNQNSPATFYSVGAEQGNGGGSTVTITLTSSPSGMSLTADGSACTAPCRFQWTPGSSHTIATTSPQAGATGTQYAYAYWSDGGAQSHPITVPVSAATYTASFNTQYYLTTTAGTGGSISDSRWANSGMVVQVSASPSSGYQFAGFRGALSGITTPQSILMDAPAAATATFSPVLSFVTASPLPGGTTQIPYSFTFYASGGVPPYLWFSNNLPAGLALSNDGVLSGTPTIAFNYTGIAVQLHDSTGAGVTQSFSLPISQGGSLTGSCAVRPGAPSPGQTVTFTANGYGGSPGYTYSWSGGWVSGSSQSPSFVPQAAGTYTASVTITDTANQTVSRSCSAFVQVAASPLTFTSSSSLPGGTVGSSYSQAVAATGGTAPYAWSLYSGPLPPGIGLSTQSGVLSGTPTTAGTYGFYITVTDSAAHSVTSYFALAISGGTPSYVQVTLAAPQVGGSYAGATHQFTFHFTSSLGPGDITSGQIVFNTDATGPTGGLACQLDWDMRLDLNITGLAFGSFGGGTLSSNYCTVYAGTSTLTQTAQGYDVSLTIGFTSQFQFSHVPIWARGTSNSWGTPGWGVSVGTWAVASPTSPSIELVVGVGPLGQPYCGGTIRFGGFLNAYANGVLSGSLVAVNDDTGAYPGWTHQASNGYVVGPGRVPPNSGSSPQTMDYEEALLPLGPSSPGQPGGTYSVVGDFIFSNPSCLILLEAGYFVDGSGTNAVSIPNYSEDNTISSPTSDPTPHIDSITVMPPLVSGATANAAIRGSNFGVLQGTLAITCHPGNRPATAPT